MIQPAVPNERLLYADVIGGVTTFFTMAYIVVVNPGILSSPGTGMPFTGALTATVLVASSMKFTEIPGRLLQHIHGSTHDEVRAIAIALLGKQSLDDLLAQGENLAELLYRGSAVERREILALFEKLASYPSKEGGPDNEARVLRVMSPLLFRAERDKALANMERAEKAEAEVRALSDHVKIQAHLASATAFRRSRQLGQRFKALGEIRAVRNLDVPKSLLPVEGEPRAEARIGDCARPGYRGEALLVGFCDQYAGHFAGPSSANPYQPE